jgi:N-acetyl-gamma-glutamyl-phosphate reductase
MGAKLKVAVLGATGYSGLELTRLLLRHPRVEKPTLLRRANSGVTTDRLTRPSRFSKSGNPESETVNLADIFPSLSGNGSYPLQPLDWASLKRQGVELLFLATPHEASRELVPEAVSNGIRVIDLSGAWRLKQPNLRPKRFMACPN